jgi:hypothetical protein
LERRVPKLRDARYLRCIKPRPHKGLYVVGPEGAEVLIQGGYAAHELVRKRRRETEWKDLTIPHALLVASIHTRLLLLAKESPITLAQWKHDGPELWDSVQTPRDGKLPVRPDAYFALQQAGRPAGKNKLHFFLEADTGTMSHARIAQKIKAYAAYHEQQRHVEKFGIDYFRVAIITETSARAQNLRDEFYPAMSAPQRRAYHFISLDELTLPELLSNIEPLR